jgi:hypothetical protein
LAVARQRSEAPFEVAAHARERRRAALGEGVEDQQPADVHVRGGIGVLELEERRVERRQWRGRGHGR